jgi:hypothetical protein
MFGSSFTDVIPEVNLFGRAKHYVPSQIPEDHPSVKTKIIFGGMKY